MKTVTSEFGKNIAFFRSTCAYGSVVWGSVYASLLHSRLIFSRYVKQIYTTQLRLARQNLGCNQEGVSCPIFVSMLNR